MRQAPIIPFVNATMADLSAILCALQAFLDELQKIAAAKKFAGDAGGARSLHVEGRVTDVGGIGGACVEPPEAE